MKSFYIFVPNENKFNEFAMKKKLLEALATKFAGVSASALERVAASLAKKVTNEDEIDNFVEGVTFAQVLESYADSRSTEAASSAIANYEKKYSLKDGKQVQSDPAKDKDKDNHDDAPAWAKALIEQNDRLQKEVAAMKSGKLVESRRAKLDEVLKDLSDAQKKGYARISVESGSDDEFNSMLEEIKTEVEGIKTESKRNGATFNAPFTTGNTKGEKASDAEIKAVADIL